MNQSGIMEYLNENNVKYCKSHQDEMLMRFIGSRLILENVEEEEYYNIMEEIFPELKDKYTYLFKHEVLPKPSLRNPTVDYYGFEMNDFVDNTPLASLKINTYSDSRVKLGTAVNTKNDVTYTTEYYLQIVAGNVYERIVTIMHDGDEEKTQVNTKLKMSIRLRIKYAYADGDTTYIAFRVGRDKKDRIFEVGQAIDTIKGIYHLSPKDCYNLKLYFEDVIPKFMKFDKPADTKVSVIDGVIHVNYPYKFDEKKVLEALIKTRKVTTQKELMDFLSLYMPITPFNVELRKNDMIMYLPLALGKGGAGKSAMVKLIVVRGFDNPDAERSEDDIYTKASFRNNFSKSIFPIMIDEITQPTMQRIYGSMKNLATGRGTHSRGRIQGGNNEWTLTSIPVFTSNEMIYIDSGMERRFFKIIANEGDNNIQEWREAKADIPDGYQYLFLKELDGMTIKQLTEAIVANVEQDEDYVYSYQLFIRNIMQRVFARNGLECPFEPVKKVVFDDDDWYVAFGQFIKQQYDDSLSGNSYLRLKHDFEMGADGYIYVTKLGFQKFLKIFSKCPFKTASTFAINAPSSAFDIVYKKKRVCGAKNPIHVIGVRERDENEHQIQLEIENTRRQLDRKN